MPTKIYQVDAFTDKPFAGNPAAVCILEKNVDDSWMQNVAREMNLSETAFLKKTGDGYNLRWFTPTVEVELCGHATLASAHILWETGLLSESETARFHSASGLLTAEKKGDIIELNFPATPASKTSAVPGLIEALGVVPVYIAKNQFDYLVEVGTEREVRQTRPDFKHLYEIDVRGIMVTAKSDSDDFDFISRFFAPGSGIDEDPVTGSAHCTLGPYWSDKMGKKTMNAYQASDRGGVVQVTVNGDRIILGGHAVTVMHGELL